MSFNPLGKLYKHLDENLKRADVNAMKTLLRNNHLPKRDAENLQTAAQIFEYLEDRGVIGEDDLSFLKTLLREIDREPLIRAVERYEREAGLDPVSGAANVYQETHDSMKPKFISSPPAVTNIDDLLAEILNSVRGSKGQICIKGRDISYKARGRIHGWDDPWVYDAWAMDLATKHEEKASHYRDESDAVRAAIRRLVDHLKSKGFL